MPLFDDGEHILYINGQYRGDDDIGKHNPDNWREISCTCLLGSALAKAVRKGILPK